MISPHRNEIGGGARSLIYLNCDNVISYVHSEEAQSMLIETLVADAEAHEQALHEAW